MFVLVDTPIWSLALRRTFKDLNPQEKIQTGALRELIREGRAQLVGPVRQELLSGIRHEKAFLELRDHLRAFDQVVLEIADYEEAARINNRCRSRGIAGSEIDFLICAIADRRNWEIFTADRDFARYAKVLPLRLYEPR
ncbi:MAG: PIN domain-containing protein [Candidatus Sulfotelmatobacter sp.]